RAQEGSRADQRRWLGVAGFATGFGISAAHFVAMLAYKSDLIGGYAPGLTFLSLLIAVGLTTAGFAVAAAGGRWMPLAGGSIVGLGIGVMHYSGMAAVHVQGVLLWSGGYVLASVLLGAVLAAVALQQAVRRGSARNAFVGGALLSLAILSHHFTAMASLTLRPMPGDAVAGTLLSSDTLGISIAAVAASLLVLAIGAAVMSRRAEVAKRRREREFRILVEGVTDCAIYMLDRDGRITSWNAGAEQLTGFVGEEVIGQHFWCLDPAAELGNQGGAALLARTAADGKASSVGWRHRKDGSRFRAHITLERVLDADGQLLGFAKFTRDITQSHEDQAKLSKLAADLDAALSNMHHGLCLFDADERLVLANGRLAEMFDLTLDACPPGTPFIDTLRIVLERRARIALDPEQIQEVYLRHRACIQQPGGGALIAEFTDDCVLSIVHRPMADGSWVSTYEDITDRRRSEARIAHMAMHDSLTGLPNREHLNQWLDGELARAERSGSKVAVIAMDLNRFKEINDTHGHASGDEVLRTLAARFREVGREDALIARFGGDEFAAIQSFHDPGDLVDFLRRLETCFAERVDYDRFSIVPGASIGIAIYPQDGTTREQLLNNADLAMYRAKATIGVQACYYEPRMDEASRARCALAQDIRLALTNGEFWLAYQVQRSVVSGSIVGYEALIRWNHPVRGNIPPNDFIFIAEDSGAIVEIGEWVLRTACAEAAGWAEPHRVAVNLSPVQLGDPNIVNMVAETLLNSGLAPSRLELEITESTIISDKARGLHVLRQIKALGVSIAIDDFGTGYSSLDTLNSFPFDKIKIDRSFLSTSATKDQSLAIIRAVLALGRSLGMPVLAEGVETQEQLDLLRTEGCEQAQGYLLGRPQSLADIGLSAAA
ncbi:MAG: hypothetical protein JWN59_1710, partial [Sphingomonas bacterium]|nr:hypothetical protein [Sphingomonas bacterium]